MSEPLNVAILVFPDVEVLDFAGPFEVFSVATRLATRNGTAAPFRPFLVAKAAGPVRARHGLQVVAGAGFADMAAPQVLIVPGGVMDAPLGDRDTLDWIGQAHRTGLLTASVCTGALLLAKVGLLDGLSVTTHWADVDGLRALAPHSRVETGRPFVDQGRIVTSGGISAGIDMSLHLVGRLTTPALAVRTARQMEYRWAPDDAGREMSS